jgi:hypothetical protein
VTKAILLLDSHGVAAAPATLCAEAAAEAKKLKLPLFDQVLAELTQGKELRANGSAGYELFQQGERVGMVEIFEAPHEIR